MHAYMLEELEIIRGDVGRFPRRGNALLENRDVQLFICLTWFSIGGYSSEVYYID
jgi:hypothetical protein